MIELLDTLDPIFADCTGDEDGRYTLTKPWVRKGVVYATNGSIVVRQSTSWDDTTDYPSPNDAPQLFDGSKPTGKAIALPDIGPELGDGLVCEKCKATDSTKMCSECKGEGVHICPTCEHEKPCRACEGEGKQRCCGCDGEGTIERTRRSVKLRPKDKIGLADFYVWLLRRHEIRTVRMAGTADGIGFRFRKGTIEGLVLGMTLGSDDDG